MSIDSSFKDAIGPASVPTKGSHGGVTSEPNVSNLAGQTSSPNCPTVIVRDGSVSGSPKVSGPVKTAFKE